MKTPKIKMAIELPDGQPDALLVMEFAGNRKFNITFDGKKGVKEIKDTVAYLNQMFVGIDFVYTLALEAEKAAEAPPINPADASLIEKVLAKLKAQKGDDAPPKPSDS